MSFGRVAGGVLLATGLAATMCVGTYWTASAMQSDLTDQARTTLAAQHLTATVTFSGRDAYVWADTPTARADAIAALKTIPGIRVVLVGSGPPPVASAATTTSARPAASVTVSTTSPTPAVTVSPSTTSAGPSTTPTALPTLSSASTSPSRTVPPVAIPSWPAVHFVGNSAKVNDAGTAQLLQMARFMVANPGVKVTLTGHSDSTGTSTSRQAVGLAGAQSAKAVLLAHGVGSARISVVSRGGNDPIASNDTSQGRALNRRVTVTMTQES